ncbi:MAG: polysulfide reductase NrfD [Desulfobacteraceae bacterium]
MNETVLYNVAHEPAYGLLILLYFFLGGMSGGAFLVSAFSRIWGGEKYNTITRIGAVSALVFIAIGGLCLLLDLGRMARFIYLFTHFIVTSPVSWGSWIILGFSICTLLFIYFLMVKPDKDKADLVSKIGIVFAIGLTSYTGFLLSMGKAHPLWHSAIMPPLFLVSSCISGLAVVLLVANLMGKKTPGPDVTGKLGKILIAFILVDIFFLSDMYVLYVGIAEANEVALLLLVGKFAFLFWGIELILGSLLPVAILSSRSLAVTRQWQLIASIFALIGVFSMRYIFIVVGQYLPIS